MAFISSLNLDRVTTHMIMANHALDGIGNNYRCDHFLTQIHVIKDKRG